MKENVQRNLARWLLTAGLLGCYTGTGVAPGADQDGEASSGPSNSGDSAGAGRAGRTGTPVIDGDASAPSMGTPGAGSRPSPQLDGGGASLDAGPCAPMADAGVDCRECLCAHCSPGAAELGACAAVNCVDRNDILCIASKCFDFISAADEALVCSVPCNDPCGLTPPMPRPPADAGPGFDGAIDASAPGSIAECNALFERAAFGAGPDANCVCTRCLGELQACIDDGGCWELVSCVSTTGSITSQSCAPLLNKYAGTTSLSLLTQFSNCLGLRACEWPAP